MEELTQHSSGSKWARLRPWVKMIAAFALIIIVRNLQSFLTGLSYVFIDDLLALDVLYEAAGVLFCALALLLLGGVSLFEFHGKEILSALKACRWMLIVDGTLGILSVAEYVESGYQLVDDWAVRLVLILIMAIGVGLYEEGLYRGVLLEGLLGPFGGKKAGVVVSCLLTGFIFGLAHVLPADPSTFTFLGVTQMALKVIQTGVCGVLWAAVLAHNRSIWGIAFAHGLTDLPLLLSDALFFSGDISTNYVTSDAEAMSTILVYLFVIALYIPLFVKSIQLLSRVKAPNRGAFEHK